MAELRGDGVHFGQPTYNQNGNETNDNTYQGRAAAVVKVGFGSGSTLDQSVSGGSGSVNGFLKNNAPLISPKVSATNLTLETLA